MTKPWKVINSDIVYQNPFFKVVKENLIRSDKSKGEFYITNITNFVAILPVTNDQSCYLIGQYRPAIKEHAWEVIEGGIDKGEKSLEAAKRELKEESGLIAGKYKFLGEYFVSNGFCTQKGYAYAAFDLKDIKLKKLGTDSGEILTRKIVTIDQLGQMIRKGEIKDATTIITYYYYKDHQRGRI